MSPLSLRFLGSTLFLVLLLLFLVILLFVLLLVVVLFLIILVLSLFLLVLTILLSIIRLRVFGLLRLLHDGHNGVLARIGNILITEVPLLHGEHNVDGELAVLPESLVPLRRHAVVSQHQHPRDTADQQLAHGALLLRVCVDVLHAAQGGVRVGFLVEVPYVLEGALGQVVDCPLLAHEVQLEEASEVLLLAWGGHGVAVEPSDKEAEGIIFVVGEGKALVFAFFLVLEDVAEELATVAEKLGVEGVWCVVGTDSDVDQVPSKEPELRSIVDRQGHG